PAGKRPGTRNRASLLAATLEEGEAEAMLRLVADKALAGDGVAARYCLDRIMPRPRGRPILLDLPEAAGAEEGGAAFGTLLAAMAAGEIMPEEALTVSRILDSKRRALETANTQKRNSHHEGTKITKGRVPARLSHQKAISSVTALRAAHRDEATMTFP